MPDSYVCARCSTADGFVHHPMNSICPNARPETEFNQGVPVEKVNHPIHYGGKDNPYEAIKVIEAWHLNFNLGNAVKYISRAGRKGDYTEDLLKAIWYIEREIKNANQTRSEHTTTSG